VVGELLLHCTPKAHHRVCSRRQVRGCRPSAAGRRHGARVISPSCSVHHVYTTPRADRIPPPIVLQPHPPSTKPSCRDFLELSVSTSARRLAGRRLCRGEACSFEAPYSVIEEGRRRTAICRLQLLGVLALGPHTQLARLLPSYTHYG
jgi:hypothetical protein